jgi:hypothetical protein
MTATQLATTKLGESGLETTRAGLGAWAIGAEASLRRLGVDALAPVPDSLADAR